MRRGTSAGSCSPSASKVRKTSAPRRAASAKPALSEPSYPRLAALRSTMAPARFASSAVPSVERSSTTMTSATCARTPATTAAIVFASLKAGMTAMTRLAEDIVMPDRAPGLDRAPRLGADDFADQRRPQADRRPQIMYRAAADDFAFGDIPGRVHAAALNDDGLFFRRHDALVAVAERRLHGADASDHGGEFRHRHGKRMIGAVARAVIGDVLLDHARAERHRA